MCLLSPEWELLPWSREWGASFSHRGCGLSKRLQLHLSCKWRVLQPLPRWSHSAPLALVHIEQLIYWECFSSLVTTTWTYKQNTSEAGPSLFRDVNANLSWSRWWHWTFGYWAMPCFGTPSLLPPFSNNQERVRLLCRTAQPCVQVLLPIKFRAKAQAKAFLFLLRQQ